MIKALRRIAGNCALALALTVAAFLTNGCQSGPKFQDVPQSVLLGASGDKLHIGDTVTVVFASPDGSQILPTHSEQIKEDGSITLTLIGSIQAVGKTAGELQREIHDAYVPKYYLNLNVTVTPPSRVYYVGGEVRSPGPKEYVGQTDIVKAIQSAGDFTDFAKKTKVRVTRTDGHTEIVNVNKAIEDPRFDVQIYPGDRIVVPRRFW